MPRIDTAGWVIWVTVALAQLALVVALLRSGAWRRWPAVLAYACLELGNNLALMCMSHPKTDFGAACYFWTYWIESSLLGLVQVWVIHEVGLSVASLHKEMRYLIGRLVPAIAIIYVLGSLLLMGFPSSADREMERLVMSTNEAATVAWLATFVTLFFSCQALGLAASRVEQGISLGFCAFLVINAVTGWGLEAGIRPEVLSKGQELARIPIYFLWIYVFLRKDPPRGEISIADLRSLLQRLTAMIHNLGAR